MGKRRYRQNCALARTGDVIGERWTLLMLRDLLISPRRFNELLESQQGMGSNLLAARLKDLEAAGLVERQASGRRYALTDKGRALEPAVLALIRWGLTYGPENQPGDHHQDDWDLLALKALFQPGRAGNLAVTAQFAADGFEGWARIADQQMCVGLGGIEHPDIVIAGSVKNLFLESQNPSELLVQGQPETLRRFVSAFALRA